MNCKLSFLLISITIISFSRNNYQFSTGYNKLKTELGIALREVELTRQLRNNANAELKLASSGDNNILQVVSSNSGYFNFQL
jgi:hypothetical protein